ncbi:ankyrin repeat domain-containing protein [Hydrogenophaga sp. IBVHS1]|uniref:ankyrin repeat domain-containing protein n=1 Tax=unclassified Hydrogenophaga TaxID=2610897 RepID=UPI0015C50755|nr:ankyrin repeat domain-containing protein [Hydrogenophaga sp. IBVHS1]
MEELLDAIVAGRIDDAIARIEALRADGVDLNTADHRGRTPAHLAGTLGHARLIEPLRAAGANLNAQDATGAVPAHGAASGDHVQTIAALHAGGANLSAADLSGRTPVHAAAGLGHWRSIEALHAGSANLSAPDHTGSTPAHAAAILGHERAILALYKADADLFQTDRNGKKPVDLAASQGKTKVANLLAGYEDSRDLGGVLKAVSGSQAHQSLAADLQCPILAEPYARVGDFRPVRLPDGHGSSGQLMPGNVISAQAAYRMLSERRPFDPLAGATYTSAEAGAFLRSSAFAQGDPERLAMVRAALETARKDMAPEALMAAVPRAVENARAAAGAAPASAAGAGGMHYQQILQGGSAGVPPSPSPSGPAAGGRGPQH